MENLGRIVAISPHLDDAVLSCGDLLTAHPGATVITVFAGVPARDVLTAWDADCGFRGAREAVRARREEDRAALALLRARSCWLDLEDRQYAHAPYPARAVAERLRVALDDAPFDTVLLPLGLFHSDHDLAHRAALRLLVADGRTRWLGYEDALYRSMPGLLERRLRRLERAGVAAVPSGWTPPSSALKPRALRCYASQVRGLAAPGRPGLDDAAAPERYWTLRTRRG